MEKRPQSTYSVRFQDCDPLGHLNNARYLDYFINAREDHLKSAYDFSLLKFMSKGMAWVIKSHEIKYLKPAVCNEDVIIESALYHYTNDELYVEGLFYNKDKTHLKTIIRTRFTHVQVPSGKKSNHPEDFMQFLEKIKCEDSIFETNIDERSANLIQSLSMITP